MFADTESFSQLAVPINGLSPVAPIILTTVPLLICAPVVFFALTTISNALVARDEVSAYDALTVEPVATVILNCVESPFVNVIVAPAADAVTNEDAVTDELTNPNAVICELPDIVPAGTPLPLTSGITTPNVVPFPFVNVRVLPLNEAVVNPKLADVFNDADVVFKASILICCEADEAFNCVIELFTLPLLVFNALILICCEALLAFN